MNNPLKISNYSMGIQYGLAIFLQPFLREINFGSFQEVKNCHFDNFGAAQIVKRAIFDLLKKAKIDFT